MSAISIIMPCYNRDYDLRRVLEAYDQQDTGIPFELIAVDDASIDHTYELLTSYRPKHYSLIVERQAANQGPAAARNRGIALAQARLTLFVGDDILPAPDFVRQHIAAHNLHTDLTTAILGYTTWPPDLTMNTSWRILTVLERSNLVIITFEMGANMIFDTFIHRTFRSKLTFSNRSIIGSIPIFPTRLLKMPNLLIAYQKTDCKFSMFLRRSHITTTITAFGHSRSGNISRD